MNDYVSLAIVGAFVSVVVQFLKSTFGTSRPQTIGVVVALSLGAGFAYYQLADSAFWDTSLKVLLAANAVYGFVISQFE